ncbi:hypothetical protein [Hymenobacter sp. ISL-91]|uniref:hypothetical protein n=1 Tax=Hymenobacter sp. ISL-91 TaxID=2819151 RepID=UPI001BECDF4A|nr:hypothetical protein [Hymenobacter sp. ISL-91]
MVYLFSLNELVASPWFAISSYVIGLTSLLIGYYFYAKSRIEKKPVLSFRSYTVAYKPDHVNPDVKVSVTYKGKEIDILSCTNIAFWNNGKQTINGNDLVRNNPLRILPIGDVNIYDFIVADVSEYNNIVFYFDEDDKSINFKFDYLDFGQGFVVKVFHDGDFATKFNVMGSVKGVDKFDVIHPSFASGYIKVQSPCYHEFYQGG